MKIAEQNYMEVYPLIDFSKLSKEQCYDCSNLNEFFKTGVDYQLISKRKDEVLKLVNQNGIIRTEVIARINMDIDNPKILSLYSSLGRHLKKGDILPTGRICKTGLPVYFTIDRIEKQKNGNTYISGKDLGMKKYDENMWYCVGKIKS